MGHWRLCFHNNLVFLEQIISDGVWVFHTRIQWNNAQEAQMPSTRERRPKIDQFS
jgi:hypothetical protein